MAEMAVDLLRVSIEKDSDSTGVIRLGHPLIDAYLELVASRARRNTLLATAFDLKVFFSIVEKEPVEVSSADVLAFITERAGLGPREAYGTLNMGVGFACYVGKGAGDEVVFLAESLGYQATVAGVVEEGAKSVVLEPIAVTYERDELELH